MQQSRARQGGFTLIELIVVIVVLGILAATALPKFVDFGTDARVASLNAARGSLSSAAAMAHGKYLTISPSPTAVAMEGTNVNLATVVVSGYPKAEAAFGTAAGLNATDYTAVAAGSAATANTPLTSATQIAFIPASAAGNTKGLTCFVMYTEPTSTTSAPTVAVTSTGC